VIQRKHGSEKIEHDPLLLFFLLETGDFPLSASGANLNLPLFATLFVTRGTSGEVGESAGHMSENRENCVHISELASNQNYHEKWNIRRVI
jgi:hypothetical protein